MGTVIIPEKMAWKLFIISIGGDFKSWANAAR